VSYRYAGRRLPLSAATTGAQPTASTASARAPANRRATRTWRAIAAALGSARRPTSVECRAGATRARSIRVRLSGVSRRSGSTTSASVSHSATRAGPAASASANRRATRTWRAIAAALGTAPRSTSVECRTGSARARSIRV